ncbi:MAG TPA: bifunctional DNA-formamidopyrimidine glycosylase/DNA-(apurinic or apyrimidinic site) lyase [Gaiellaceae bacterium]|jgi:formamidopyrimidine-DNA glycosylase|nr:bifunctional DNA-formamidopyrimidine glycosylase/DNA-(apurinic or apyrimidinic site) lyase [Gaiellaceae bacterium]
MPELPEVESVRLRLVPVLEGRKLERVEIMDARLTRPFDPDEVARELEGERVSAVDRRGKYLIVRFESGRSLLVHLRMTGSLRAWNSADRPAGSLPDDPYRRAVVTLDDSSDVAYRDVRRFGTWLLLEPGELEPYLDARVGPEPLGRAFAVRDFGARLARRAAPVKSVILDQRTVAGVGNIYADEALWRARLHPLREARSLDPDEVAALHKAIRDVLKLGIKRQGATLRDYALPDGGEGGMQHEFKVYGRAGEPCERCGTPIERIVVGGRGTWYCPQCQPSPLELARRVAP